MWYKFVNIFDPASRAAFDEAEKKRGFRPYKNIKVFKKPTPPKPEQPGYSQKLREAME
jgi:hypothetical protein